MTRTLSSQKFIGFTVIAIVAVIALWFVVPLIWQQIGVANYIAKHYVVAVDISDQQRQKTEQDIRDREDQIKKGDMNNDALADQYIHLGSDFELIGRLDLAVDAYKKSSQYNMTSSTPYANLGSAYTTAQDYELAKDAYQKAISITPTEPSHYVKLAELYWHTLDQVAVARGVYIQGLMGTDQEMGLMRSYASFLEQTGYTSESLLYWQAILAKDPKDSTAKDRIKALTPPAPAKPSVVPPVKKK